MSRGRNRLTIAILLVGTALIVAAIVYLNRGHDDPPAVDACAGLNGTAYAPTIDEAIACDFGPDVDEVLIGQASTGECDSLGGTSYTYDVPIPGMTPQRTVTRRGCTIDDVAALNARTSSP